jgi:hypothetical protein
MAFDLTGLSGYALEYAKAANKGATDDAAHTTANRAIGGSGITKADVDKITAGSTVKQNVTYRPNTGYARTKYDSPDDEAPVSRSSSTPSGGSGASSGSSGSDIESLFAKYFGNDDEYTYEAPDENTIEGWAQSYADAQTDPYITAIQNALTNSLGSQETARTEVAAKYAGLDEKYAAQLEEARNAALESSIARGMGRSGVVDYQTQKYSNPILTSQREDDAAEAASLASIANTIAGLNTNAQNSLTAAEKQRGTLKSSRMGDLQQWVEGMKSSAGQNKFNNALSLADLQNNSAASSNSLLLQLLPLFMGGT